MQYRLTTLLLARLRSLDDWEANIPQGAIEERLTVLDALAAEVTARHGGTVHADPLGRFPGSHLSTYDSPTAALRAALQLRLLAEDGRPGLPRGAALLGLAVNTGEVALRSGHIIGRPLDVVSRLEHRAEAGQILFSESVLLSLGDSTVTYHPLMRSVGAETGPAMSCYVLEGIEEEA